MTATANFDIYFKNKNKDKKHVPNLRNTRSRSSSTDSKNEEEAQSQNDQTEPSTFKTPKKFAKRRATKENNDIPTSNNYDALSDTMSVEGAFEPTDKIKIKKPTNETKTPITGNTSRSETHINNNTDLLRPKKPPPIHVYGKTIKALVKLINDTKIGENDFWLKQNNSDYVNVMPQNLETYKAIKEILNKANCKYFTYTSKEEKKISLMLKGIKSDYNEDDIKLALENKNLINTKIEKISKFCFDE